MTLASKLLITAIERARAAGEALVICHHGAIPGMMYPTEHVLVDARVLTIGPPERNAASLARH